ncbi:MAG: hypothetical protein NVS4B3_13490 [Gemmatimonadaceae bacterium]
MRLRTLAHSALWILVAVDACSRRATNDLPPANAPASIRVINDGFADMNIFMLRSGERIRLGTVTGLSSAVFTIRAALLFGPTSFRFVSEPIGGSRSPVSEEITVSPGDEITLRIPPG